MANSSIVVVDNRIKHVERRKQLFYTYIELPRERNFLRGLRPNARIYVKVDKITNETQFTVVLKCVIVVSYHAIRLTVTNCQSK